jgi:two-component system, NtrC family, sensor kinase
MLNLKIVLVVVSCCVWVAAHAQPVSERDSLIKLLRTLPNDTDRVQVLNALGFRYRQSNPDSTYLLANQAYELSLSLQYRPGEARALATKAAAFKFLGDYAKSLALYNQAKEVNQRINDWDRVAVILNNTADLYIQQEQWQKGLATMRECFAIYNKLDRPQASSESVFLTNLAECFYHVNQLDSATHCLQQALQLAEKGQESALSAIYYLLGDVALAQRNRQQARFFYLRSAQEAARQESFADSYESYFRLALLYGQRTVPDSAIYFAKLGLTYSQRANYLKGVLKSGHYLASLFEKKNDAEALRYFKIAVAAKDSLYSQANDRTKVKELLLGNFGSPNSNHPNAYSFHAK